MRDTEILLLFAFFVLCVVSVGVSLVIGT
jgi:hypothetical protein